MANTVLAPSNGSSMPPSAGPRTPEIFICTPPNVTAEASSSFVTTSGITELQAGALHANPTPNRKTAARIMLGLKNLSVPITASPPAATISQTCMTHSSFLRFSMSARAPAGNVKRKKGRAAAVDKRERNSGEGVKVFIAQVAAMS
jgi:hypothetical protein